MGEIRFVGTGETSGYPYVVCKKRYVGADGIRGYPHTVCKNTEFSLVLVCSLCYPLVYAYYLHCLFVFYLLLVLRLKCIQ